MTRYEQLIVVLIAACPALALVCGCEATASGETGVATVEKKNGDSNKQAKHDELSRKLDIARRKLDKARMASTHSQAGYGQQLAKAEEDLVVASTKLQHFRQHTSVTRTARAELDLQRSEDSYQEAQEELAQLEIMYAEEDFADKTKEIVLQRGKRRLERSKRNLEIRRPEVAFLKSETLPLEEKELQLKLEEAQRTLEKTRREAESAELDKAIAVLSAEAELAKLEFELGELEQETDK